MTFTDDDLRRLKAESESVHPTNCRPWISGNDLKALIARLEAHEAMSDYICHEHFCILNRNERGEPTPDGGYRMMYAGKWYQSSPVDETPKCNCGLDDLWNAWRKSRGSNDP